MLRMWVAGVVECSGCGMFGMLDVRNEGCSRCGMLGCGMLGCVCWGCVMFGMCGVGDMGYLGCGMFGMWYIRDVWHVRGVGCSRCGMLQNILDNVKYPVN